MAGVSGKFISPFTASEVTDQKLQAECEDSLLSFPVPDTAALFNDSLDNDLNPDLLLEASLPTESAAEPSNLTTTPVEMTNLDDSLGCEDMDETQLPLEDEGAPPSMGVDNGDSVKQTDLNDSLGCEDMDETQLPAGHGDETLHDPKINAGETDLNDSLRCEDMEDSQLPLEDVDTDGLVGAPNIATASSVEKTELNVSLGCDVTDETQLPEDITVSSVNKETVPTIADDVCNDPTPASQLPQCDVTQGSNSDDKNTSNTPKKSTSSAATEAPTTTLTKNKTSSENHQSPSSADGRPTSTLGAKVKPSFGKKKGFIAPKPKTTPPSTNTSPKGKESCGDSDEHEPKKETDSKSSGSKANNKKPSGFLAPTTVTKNLPSTSSSAETDTSSVDVQENDNTSVVEKASNKVKSKSKTSESTKTKDSQHKKTEKEAKKQEREELKKEKALKKQELEKEKERKKAEKERQKEEMHLEQERKKAEREQKKMERKLKKLEQEKNKAEKQTAGQKKKSKAKTLSNATKEQSKSDDDITDRQCEETGENRGEGEESMIPIKSTDITDESECAIPEAKKTSCDDELGQHTAPDSDRDEPSNSSSDHKPSSQPTDNPENKPNENNKTEVAVTHSTDGEVVPLEVNDKSEESDSKVCTNIIDPRSEDQKSENKQVSSDDTAKVSDSTGPKLASKKFDPPKKQKHKKEKATTKKALDSHTSNRATKTTKKKPTSNESSAAVSAQKGKKRKASSESESDGEPQMKRSKSANYSGPVWVQCENSNCKKWRQLKDCLDPALVPEKWLCSMNSDENYNSCSAPEEHWSDLGESQEFVESPFVPGSVVWAKMDGYPWWPAMIEEDPDDEAYYEMGDDGESLIPVKYHVVFFDTTVCRAWVSSAHVIMFTDTQSNPNEDINVVQRLKRPLREATRQAKKALGLDTKERLSQFGFIKRYQQSGRNRKRKSVFNDNHECIRPTTITSRGRKSARLIKNPLNDPTPQTIPHSLTNDQPKNKDCYNNSSHDDTDQNGSVHAKKVENPKAMILQEAEE